MHLLSRLFFGPILLLVGSLQGQQPDRATEADFWSRGPAHISFRQDVRALRETDDSLQLPATIVFRGPKAGDTLPVYLRQRGQFRRKMCYFTPLTLRFEKPEQQGTALMGQRELKLVLPCQPSKDAEDLVLKEFLAYRMYQAISPYHYKTREVEVEVTLLRGKRENTHSLNGFFLEDHGDLAQRLGARRIHRHMPAPMQDAYYSVLNNLFQFLIGHTDYSLRLQHNQRLYFVDDTYLSIPYDFDMSGLVNAPYATVSNIQNLDGSITHVTQRIYKGYRRDHDLIQEVRKHILNARARCFDILEAYRDKFHDPKAYESTHAYLEAGFDLLARDNAFERKVLGHLRE